MDVLAVGAGQALKIGARDNADVLLVHERDREEQVIRWLTSPETQRAIGNFGPEKFDQPLFHPYLEKPGRR